MVSIQKKQKVYLKKNGVVKYENRVTKRPTVFGSHVVKDERIKRKYEFYEE